MLPEFVETNATVAKAPLAPSRVAIAANQEVAIAKKIR
jgi:hypothetical protein